jgi:hypothetical protein
MSMFQVKRNTDMDCSAHKNKKQKQINSEAFSLQAKYAD